MPIRDKDRKILWSRSGGLCAICQTPLVETETEQDAASVIGEEAHIIAQQVDGPRGQPIAPDVLDAYDNLILLCRNHHKKIDDQVGRFTVEHLRNIKADHERSVSRKLASSVGIKWRLIKDGTAPTQLAVINSATALDVLLERAVQIEFDHDDNLEQNQIDAIAGFSQYVKDYMDQLSDFSVSERLKARYILSSHLGQLEQLGLELVGSLHHNEMDSGSDLLPWPTASLILRRKSTTDVTLTGEGGFEVEDHLPSLTSDEVFSWRLSDAFPGEYGLVEVPGAAAVDRLTILFRKPLHQLSRQDGRSFEQFPFWWFRGPINYHISEFRRLEPQKCLLDEKELLIGRVVSHRPFLSHSLWDFLYIEALAEPASGAYQYEREYISNYLGTRDRLGYFFRESFGLWNGRVITAGEYSDGAALIDGKPVRVKGAELRERYLTPFNMIICGNRHVINETMHDDAVEECLDDILQGKRTVDELARLVMSFRKPLRYSVEEWD